MMWAIVCPTITWTNDGGASWGPGNDPWTNGAEDFAEVFGLSVTKGKHQMKFGGGYNRYTKNQVIGKDSEGDYTFNDQGIKCSDWGCLQAIRIWTSCSVRPPASVSRMPIPSTTT